MVGRCLRKDCLPIKLKNQECRSTEVPLMQSMVVVITSSKEHQIGYEDLLQLEFDYVLRKGKERSNHETLYREKEYGSKDKERCFMGAR